MALDYGQRRGGALVTAFQVGESVTIGGSSTVYVIRDLREERDSAGEPYVMAAVVNESGRVAQSVETSRLRRVR